MHGWGKGGQISDCVRSTDQHMKKVNQHILCERDTLVNEPYFLLDLLLQKWCMSRLCVRRGQHRAHGNDLTTLM